MPASQTNTTPEPTPSPEPFKPIYFNNPVNLGIQYLMPGTGVTGYREDGAPIFDPAQATWLQFREGRYQAKTEEQAEFLRAREQNVYEAEPKFSKACKTCGRVWQASGAWEVCVESHARN